MPASRPVLLYDRECRLCRFAARVVGRLDQRGELAILPLQDEAAAPLLAELPESERSATWRLARPDGSLTGYGAGAPELLAAMTVTRRVGRLLGHVPEGVLNRLYALAARNRSTLGRFVPDGPAPRRIGSPIDNLLVELAGLHTRPDLLQAPGFDDDRSDEDPNDDG